MAGFLFYWIYGFQLKTPQDDGNKVVIVGDCTDTTEWK